MPVYIDPLFNTPRSRNWRYSSACHMFTYDDVEGLHVLAARIGLKRSWFQNKKGRDFPHYDLTENKRREAVKNGAIEITRRQFSEMRRARQREKKQIPPG